MMLAFILFCVFILTLGKWGESLQRNNMTADDHRREAQSLFIAAANDTNRSRINKNYTQAMAHLQIADEMDANNGRPTD